MNFNTKKRPQGKRKPCDLLTYTWLELTPTRVKDALRFHMLKRMSSIFNRKQGQQLIQGGNASYKLHNLIGFHALTEITKESFTLITDELDDNFELVTIRK
jgi:hypothetical protein